MRWGVVAAKYNSPRGNNGVRLSVVSAAVFAVESAGSSLPHPTRVVVASPAVEAMNCRREILIDFEPILS
jgi:hypothetical protein